ncbi:unnamed protein product, partial [marine sediment metagenome]
LTNTQTVEEGGQGQGISYDAGTTGYNQGMPLITVSRI